ncbi:STAS-like domain-containing protein [Thermodesulfobacteriota bacterium]
MAEGSTGLMVYLLTNFLSLQKIIILVDNKLTIFFNIPMSSRGNILEYLRKNHRASGREISDLLGISRQAVNKHLKELIQRGDVVKEGVTRGARYRLREKADRKKPAKKFTRTYALKHLEEDVVFRESIALLDIEHELSPRALEIVQYAFTEMLNNAIDHSDSADCSVEIDLDRYNFYFKIRDFGIGIFYSIFEKLALPDENAAMGELIKGKTTTMAERHTGEGIFFTSKSADRLSLRSHKINLIFDNLRKDVFVEEKRYLKGSEVVFRISKLSRKRLDKIFHEYAPEEHDYRFDRTRVQVKLFHKKYISRSEARRLLHGLDKFTEIILDFKGVKSIGQGFADETFRVFRQTHPHITIKTENLSPPLEQMIHHVVDN